VTFEHLARGPFCGTVQRQVFFACIGNEVIAGGAIVLVEIPIGEDASVQTTSRDLIAFAVGRVSQLWRGADAVLRAGLLRSDQ